jgi:hypothetical protein
MISIGKNKPDFTGNKIKIPLSFQLLIGIVDIHMNLLDQKKDYVLLH